MIMVIFGAGASYDSVPSRPPHLHQRPSLSSRPPLATELFHDVDFVNSSLDLFHECHPIVPYLRSIAPGETFEHKLETLQAEGDADSDRKRQIAAVRFYLQKVISEYEVQWNKVAHGITNYVSLLDQLRRSRENEPVLLVTFNYDRMIEDALKSVNISISALPHYIERDTFKLFKLHGSVHWAREVEGPATNISEGDNMIVAHAMIDRVAELTMTERFRLVHDFPPGKIDDIPLFPAIAIPVETKSGFECPPDHLDCLREHLGRVTKILTIGWRATERHFLKLLKEKLTAVVNVQAVARDKQEAEEVLDRIKCAGISLIGHPAATGFSEYVSAVKPSGSSRRSIVFTEAAPHNTLWPCPGRRANMRGSSPAHASRAATVAHLAQC